MDFKTQAKQIFDKMGIDGDVAPDVEGYYVELVDPFDREQAVFIREGSESGSLELYATIADNSQDQSILMRTAMKQNLLSFRRHQNMVGIDEATESLILCGRFDSANSEQTAFSEWLDDYMLELQQYHELADALSRPTQSGVNQADDAGSADKFLKV
jgi:hypothetical protein